MFWSRAKTTKAAAQLWHDFIQKHPDYAAVINELGTVQFLCWQIRGRPELLSQGTGICLNFISAKPTWGSHLYLNRPEEAVAQFVGRRLDHP